MSKFSNGFIAGIFTGAALGTIVGILYAPDKGQVTRDKLSYRFNSYVSELESYINRLRSHREELSSDAKAKGDKVVLEARRQADQLIAEAEQLMRSATNQASS
jgi:gas vesicle protein